MKNLLTGLIIFLGGLVACNQRVSNSNSVSLPAAQLINEKGELVDLSSFKGKKVFVNLWATWCPPCVAEMPSIQELYNQTRSSNTEFIMLSLDKNFDIAKQWALQKNYNLPLYYASGDLPEALQVAGIPTTFIFDEEGNLIFNHVGSEDYSRPKFVKMLTEAGIKK
jgi:thiol-disulfide isomerase/thioredoxin